MKHFFVTPHPGRFSYLVTFGVLLSLTGCQSVLQSFGPVGEAVQLVAQPKSTPAVGALAGHEHMVIEVNGRQTGVVLGQRTHTQGAQGPLVDEYWYSAGREMLHLRNGRLHTVLGMPTEWRGQLAQAPNWTSLDTQALSWTRTRDEMPHYRYGVTDRVESRVVPQPPFAAVTWPASGRALRWVQDRVQSTTAQGQPWVYVQHFALSENQVVFSEQCIAPRLCLRIQHRP